MTVSQEKGPGTTVTYAITPGQRRERDRLEAMLGERLAALDQINDKLADLDTHAAEAVATLYSVWNDFLLDGESPTDMQIATAFLEDWHPEKPKKFKRGELAIWLDWMRRNGLVPKGRGPKTITGRLFP
jgi:type I restriction enzyme S subunit